jgi:beta-mannosidase
VEPGVPLDLSGSWRAVESSGDLHHRFVEADFRDDAWLALEVPGHWRAHPDLATSDGPVLYRRAFTTSRPGTDRRAFLVFDGVFYDGDVWLDSTYLGATQGYFFPHAFEVTPQLHDRQEHVVAVEVGCATGGGQGTRRAVTGVYADLDTNPGGIWRPVRIVETGPVRLARVRALCVDATEDRGRIVVAVTLDAGGADDGERRREPLPARLTVAVRGPDGDLLGDASRDVPLATGENHVSLTVEVEHPPRWWPRALGDQPLCRLDVAVDVAGERSDSRTLRTAFRDVRMRRFELSVNGEPMFVRGSTLAPTRVLLASASPEELRRDVALACDANLDLVRVHGHVSRPELYDAADERGLLVWQDVPLRHRYARTARGEAVRQARELVELLGHRPSIAMWCAHDEPYGDDARAASLFLPSWNKEVLDRSVTRALRRADATRPVESHSGVPPGPFATGSDAHLVGGWHDGLLDGLAPALRAFPRLARFVGAFGAPAPPPSEALATPARWPDEQWIRDASHGPYAGDVGALVPGDEDVSFAAWTKAARERQAALVQLAVEDVRRVRGRPAVGFCHFLLAGGPGGVTCAIVDDDRARRPAYDALRDSCRPVLPMLDPRTGDVHVVNECAAGLDGAVVRAVTDDGPVRVWTGDVAGRAVSFVGRLDEPLDGDADVVVVLEHPTVGTVENRYRTSMLRHVARPPRRGALSMLKRASAG